MSGMTDAIAPALFLIILILSFCKKREPYRLFVEGSKSAVSLALSVFPYLVAVLVCVQIFKAGGLATVLANVTEPFLEVFGIPKELAQLLLVRPLSGSGGLGILQTIYEQYGVDSFVGLAASVLYGASESVLYLLAVYFSAGAKKCPPYAVFIALLSSFCGICVGILVLRLF